MARAVAAGGSAPAEEVAGRRTGRWDLGRQPEVGENLPDDDRVLDRGDHPHAPATPGARVHDRVEVALRVVGARAAALRGGGIRPFCGPGEKGPCGPAPGEALSCRRLRELGEAAPQVAGRARRPRSSADLRARLMVSRLGGSTPDARADDGIPRGRRGPATRGSVRAVKTSWTPGELRVLEIVAEEKGWDYAISAAERILAEARMVEGPDLEGLDEPLPV